eukprot:TRINITY_DN10255_c0_g2_i1.p1 TRINITY_DN10255_c0_g2~~TRINITY_DN10255_c0_g2_i1.p1  ORF type:complete len:720 (-),score=103.10 TRINITY_DN10255_c0_g2_i1:601-2760(-)
MDPSEVTPTICLLLLKLGCALTFGFWTVRCGIIKDREGFGFLAGRIMLPLLAFKTIVLAQLGVMECKAIIACVWGKLVVFLLMIFVSFVVLRKRPKSDRLLAAGIFGFHVTASNDFVVGLPIVDAFFPTNGQSQLTILVLAQLLLFQCGSLVLVEVGLSQVPDPARGSGHVQSQLCRTLAKNILWNPLVGSVLVALLWKLVFAVAFPSAPASSTLPRALREVVEFFTLPYPFLAMFLTGANLTNAFSQIANIGATDAALYSIGVPMGLCLLKNFVCAYVSLSLMQLLDPEGDSGGQNWHMFCFMYGCIPTSNAPLFVALQAGRHREVIAAAIFIGLIASVPMLIIFASLFGSFSDELLRRDIGMVQRAFSSVSFAGALAVLATVAFWARQEKSWRRRPNNFLPQYAFSCLVYSILVFVVHTHCNSSAVVTLFTLFQMQCRIGAMVMLCCLVLGPFSDRVTGLFLAAFWLLPIPLCLAVPPSTLNEVCQSQFSEQELLIHSVFVTTALAVMLLLGILALQQRHGRAAVTDTTSTLDLLTVQPQAAILLERESAADSLDIASQETTPARADSARQSGPWSQEAVAAMEASENLILSSRTPAGIALRVGTDNVTDAPSIDGSTDADRHSRLAVCALAVAAKATVVLLLQMCLSWSVYFDRGRAGPSFLQGMLVENSFEHSQGLFLLLLVIGLFDTPLSLLFRRIRSWAKRRSLSRSFGSPCA